MDSSKHFPSTLFCFFFILLLLLSSLSFIKSDINQDKQKCTNALVGLSTCLPYVTVNSKAKAPTMDCCGGLKQVLLTNKECLCILVKDRNDPSLGLNINATLALGLPDTCQTPTNITQCIDLLHLTPSSPDAKVFQGYESISKGSNTTTAAPTGDKGKGSTTTNVKSDGGSRRMKWFKKEMAFGLFLVSLLLHIFPGIHVSDQGRSHDLSLR